jgi:hypothetical protein
MRRTDSVKHPAPLLPARQHKLAGFCLLCVAQEHMIYNTTAAGWAVAEPRKSHGRRHVSPAETASLRRCKNGYPRDSPRKCRRLR